MIKEMESTAETNTVWFEDRGWCVFTSSFDTPEGWTGAGWEISSQCGLGYLTTVWSTKDKAVVQRDLDSGHFNIEPTAFEKL